MEVSGDFWLYSVGRKIYRRRIQEIMSYNQGYHSHSSQAAYDFSFSPAQTAYQMSTYAVTVYHRKMMVKDEPVLVDIWDTAGQEQFNSMHASYYHQAHACILVFDVTRKLTYKNLIPWYRELREYRSEIPCLCAANKIDVNYDVTRRNFMLPKKYSMPLYLVSASDGTNVVKLFEDAIDLALKYKKNPSDFMDVVLQELESLDVGDDFDGE